MTTTVRTLLAQRGYDDAAIRRFIHEQRICTADCEPRRLSARQRRAVSLATGTQRIPNGPLREAFIATGRTAGEVAAELGWFDDRKSRTTDTSRVSRALGTKVTGSGIRQQSISVDMARQIAAVLDADLSLLYPDEFPSDGTQCVECGESLWWATGDTCGFCVEERARGIAA